MKKAQRITEILERSRNEKYFRNLVFNRYAIDEEKRTVEVAFSSEEPYERWFGMEILGHDKGEVDMVFMGSGSAPFLKDHDTRKQIGVVEKAWIDSDRVGRAVVRFSKNPEGEEIFRDVVDGIRKNISVGYEVINLVLVEAGKDGPDTYRAVSWRPLEASMVSIPADTTVGVGRNKEGRIEVQEKTKTPIKEHSTMKDENDKIKGDRGHFWEESEERKNLEKELSKKMTDQNAEIAAIGEKNGMVSEALVAIRDNIGLDKFRELVIDTLRERTKKPIVDQEAEIGMNGKELKRYSIVRALRLVAAQRGVISGNYSDDAAFEIECHKEAAKKQPEAAKGIIIPADVLRSHMAATMVRTLSAGTATDGAELVGTDTLVGSFIDVLRNRSVVLKMGARSLTGLVGNVGIPRKTSGSSSGWISTEGGDAGNSEPQFDTVSLSPKTLGVYAAATRNLLMQSSMDVEMMIKDDLMRGMGTGIDLASLYGTGASGQPTGVSQQTGINAPTAFAAANPTWAEIIAMETAVAVDNADEGNMGYILEPTLRGHCKSTEKTAANGAYMWENGSTPLNGYKAGVTNQVTAGDLFFGNWLDLIVAMWGGLDMIVDPYTNALSGGIRIIAHQSVDIAVRQPVSFAFNNDGV